MSDTNNKEVDLFFVLGAVIDPEDVVPDEDTREIIYLRDQPVRDVLDKLMKQQMERSAFSTVLHNMSRYVQVVHWRPYPEAILNDYALFLNTLVKHTCNWRRTEWDINPLFTMSAILLKEHPYYFAVSISYLYMYVQLLIQMIDSSSTNPNFVSTRNPKLHDQSRRCCQIACILFSHSTYPWWSYRECICVNYPRRSQGRPFATTKVTQGYIAYLVGGKVYLDLFLQYGLFTLSILVDLLGQQT